MQLIVRDSNEVELATVDFDLDTSLEKKVTTTSSTGSSVHSFYDNTPAIYVTVPGYAGGEIVPEDAEEESSSGSSVPQVNF
jgi:hypothetical protein